MALKTTTTSRPKRKRSDAEDICAGRAEYAGGMSKLRFSWAPVLMATAMGVGGLACEFLSPPFSNAQTAILQRTVQGIVSGSGDVPLPGAVVYLKDLKTLGIRSFISTGDGTYRFGQMTSGTDYELWADFKGKKSSVKTLSSFDNRKQSTVDLKIK